VRRGVLTREDKPMRFVTILAFAMVLAVGLVATVATTDEATLTGKIMCAKCTLKKADAKECQDVLVVTDDQGTMKEYYVTKNEVLQKFGHTCSGEKPAVVTGTVSEKDGKMWITPTKMEEQK
jgi:hypothetical protein